MPPPFRRPGRAHARVSVSCRVALYFRRLGERQGRGAGGPHEHSRTPQTAISTQRRANAGEMRARRPAQTAPADREAVGAGGLLSLSLFVWLFVPPRGICSMPRCETARRAARALFRIHARSFGSTRPQTAPRKKAGRLLARPRFFLDRKDRAYPVTFQLKDRSGLRVFDGA